MKSGKIVVFLIVINTSNLYTLETWNLLISYRGETTLVFCWSIWGRTANCHSLTGHSKSWLFVSCSNIFVKRYSFNLVYNNKNNNHIQCWNYSTALLLNCALNSLYIRIISTPALLEFEARCIFTRFTIATL